MRIFFDLLIAILIIITALPAVILLYSRTSRKHSWERKHKNTSLLISIILLLGTLIVSYGSWIEPKLLITNFHTIDLPNINKPTEIVFLADIHAGKYKQEKYLKRIVDKILLLKPEIVLLGGDQIDNEFFNPQEFIYLNPLKSLAKQIPTYAIHGNHEYGLSCPKGVDEKCFYTGDINNEARQALEDIGIKYLTNDLERIDINNSSFYLFGGDSYWAKKLDFSILETRTEDIPTIALIHNPSFILNEYPILDLVLSGHTHGGQIRLPFLGPAAYVDNILSRKYYQGLHQLIDGTKLLVSSGAGETGVRARLFNPPEIVMITIK